MKQIVLSLLAGTLLLFSLALLPLSSQMHPPQPQTLPLQCAEGDCPLLQGIPQTAGMRSGFVRLKRGGAVGWHTTGQNEEALVLLRGRGEARIEGQPGRAIEAPMLVYIPPATRHNVANTGDEPLEYVYVVSAATLAQEQTASPLVPETYWPTHGWRSSTPEAQGMDSEVLAQAFDYVRQNQIPIHSLLIVRNGYVVLDAYFYPFQEGQVHDGASMTKSITSTLIGIAIGEHELGSLRQPVLSLFPGRSVANRDERKDRMAVEDLLTMTSGLDCHVDHAEITLREMMQSKDWVQFMLDRPMLAEPGSKFEYCSGGMHLLSGIISQTTGSSELEFARRELFQPLGIADVIWPSDPQGVSHGWGDLHLRPRDMAKIGYLWLHQGRWEGRQIVPAEWMQAATQAHSHPGRENVEYGYGFWVYPQRGEYEALGRGGQRITVTPAENRIVVFTGGEFEPGNIGKFIGESIKSGQPLPENPVGQARLAAAVSAATRPPEAPATPMSKVISGRKYVVEANPRGLKSFSLTFSGHNEAVARLEYTDGRVEQRPLGLDGVPRLSPGGRFGLPVALQGRWETNNTFVFDYDEVANINCYRYRLTFVHDDVSIELSEKTGLVEAKFQGKSAGN